MLALIFFIFQNYRFQFNLCTGLDPNSDRPLHISVRFHPRAVVINSFQMNSWGSEEKNGIFPFFTGKDFTLMILVDPAAYRVRHFQALNKCFFDLKLFY